MKPLGFISKVIESKPDWPIFDEQNFLRGDSFTRTREVSEWVNATVEYRLRGLNGSLDTPINRAAVKTTALAVLDDLLKLTGIRAEPVVTVDFATAAPDDSSWLALGPRYSVRWRLAPWPTWWTPVDANEVMPGGVGL